MRMYLINVGTCRTCGFHGDGEVFLERKDENGGYDGPWCSLECFRSELQKEVDCQMCEAETFTKGLPRAARGFLDGVTKERQG